MMTLRTNSAALFRRVRTVDVAVTRELEVEVHGTKPEKVLVLASKVNQGAAAVSYAAWVICPSSGTTLAGMV